MSVATVKVVAMMLTTYANPRRGYEAWPSVRTLARDCSLGRTTTQNALRTIERLGWFERRHAGYGGRPSATYILRIGQVYQPRAPSSSEGSEDATAPGNRITLPQTEHRETLRTAYKAALWKRHGVRSIAEPQPEVWSCCVEFVADLAAEYGRSFEAVAELTMSSYLAQPSRPGGDLEQQCHPLGWLAYALAPTERDVRAELRRPSSSPAPAETAETVAPVTAPATAAAAAAGIAQSCQSGSRAA
jgi:hypothetical protein